jgi:hypothetical protein
VSWSGISGATIDLESYRNDGIYERRDFAVTGNLIRGTWRDFTVDEIIGTTARTNSCRKASRSGIITSSHAGRGSRSSGRWRKEVPIPSTSHDLNYGFSDCHGYKDFVSWAQAHLFRPFANRPDMDVDRVFFALWYGLGFCREEFGDFAGLGECQELLKAAAADCQAGGNGYHHLEQFGRIIRRFRTQ